MIICDKCMSEEKIVEEAEQYEIRIEDDAYGLHLCSGHYAAMIDDMQRVLRCYMKK